MGAFTTRTPMDSLGMGRLDDAPPDEVTRGSPRRARQGRGAKRTPQGGIAHRSSAEGKPEGDTERSVWQLWGFVRGLRPSTGSGERPKESGRIIHGGVFSASVQSPPGGRLSARFGRHALIRPPVSLGALRALGGLTWGYGVPRR
mgnify:CR=1 FL=1